jgi:hypothetical protein
MSSIRARACLALACGLFVVSIGSARTLPAQDSASAKVPLAAEIHGFIEVYYRSGDPLVKDGYRLRKADLKFSGEISPRIHWRIAFDAAKALAVTKVNGTGADTALVTDVAIDQKSRLLQDAALTVKLNPAMSIDVGQQIIPLSLEGTISTWNVETIERTNFIVERSRAVGLGDIREVGVSANGTTRGLEYHVGLFNETGEAAGTTDPNDEKTVMGRLAYHVPALPGLQIGGSGGYQGGPNPQHRERAAGEIQYKDNRLTLRVENMAARDGALRRYGWYSLGAYRPAKDVQIVARYDEWDRDRGGESSIANAFQRQIVLGTSWFIDNSVAKFAVNVVHQTFPNISSVRSATFGLVAFEALW